MKLWARWPGYLGLVVPGQVQKRSLEVHERNFLAISKEAGSGLELEYLGPVGYRQRDEVRKIVGLLGNTREAGGMAMCTV